MFSETHSFEFGEFLLDTKERVLLRKGKPVSITPKVFQLLLALIQNHGHIVEKETLMATVWAGSFVEESNLTFNIRQLRKLLGDETQNPNFIETVPRRGYRFIAEVRKGNLHNGIGEKHDIISVAAENLLLPDRLLSRPILLAISTVLAGIVIITAGFFVWRGSRAEKDKGLFRSDSGLKFETVVSSDKPVAAAISGDGKYIAYANTASSRQSLWLRQLSSGINTQIVGPEDGVHYFSIEFSDSGEYIYFTRRHREDPVHLDRVSIIGGKVKTNILTGLDGAFSISPDDRRISFRRYGDRRRSLLVANIDGSSERTVFYTSRSITDNVFSPDGKTIAFASGQSDTGDQDFGIYTVDADTGEVRSVNDFRWFHVRGIVWLPDQSGFLVTARVKNDDPQQLWKISMASGDIKKITDAQNAFDSISATSDLSQILLTQTSRSSNLFLTSTDAIDQIESIAPATEGVAWSPDGSLIYSSASSGNNDIWLLDPGRTEQKQLTTESSADFTPKISPDGRYIVFVSDRSGKNNLWRMNADGSNCIQLTSGEGEQNPVFTPDAAFVVFNSMNDVSLWKVSIDGGEILPISEGRALSPSISPDGTMFAHFARRDNKSKIIIKSFPGGEVLKEFAIPEGHFAGRDVVWTKSNFVLYVAEDNNLVGNLWQQSLDGSAPERLTNYNTEGIFFFDYSPESSRLALIRGSWRSDLVLLTGLSR